VFVDARPALEVIDNVFSESEEHSAVYIDRDAIELRMEQIVSPKLDWCMNVFQLSTGRSARTLIDVGAGGGHFLAGRAWLLKASKCPEPRAHLRGRSST
jgi:2-polyprenyl-3-methyl-5-hydroxy-6-metoxy-1,4-benzoquinol methylase